MSWWIYLSLSHLSETRNLSLSLAMNTILPGLTDLNIVVNCERDTVQRP